MHLASERMQVIVATQSVSNFLIEFSVDDFDRRRIAQGWRFGLQTASRSLQFRNVWLQDFSVGELWDKNVSRREALP